MSLTADVALGEIRLPGGRSDLQRYRSVSPRCRAGSPLLLHRSLISSLIQRQLELDVDRRSSGAAHGSWRTQRQDCSWSICGDFRGWARGSRGLQRVSVVAMCGEGVAIEDQAAPAGPRKTCGSAVQLLSMVWPCTAESCDLGSLRPSEVLSVCQLGGGATGGALHRKHENMPLLLGCSGAVASFSAASNFVGCGLSTNERMAASVRRVRAGCRIACSIPPSAHSSCTFPKQG